MAALPIPVQSLRSALPRGGQLPRAEWERRHRGLTTLLWVLAAALALTTVVLGYPLSHSVLHVGPLVATALLSRSERFSRQVRSLACSFGLLTVAALGVHLATGRIEAHFSFFVLVILLTLYEDWLVFLLAVGYVLLHHGGLGMIDPTEVFHDADQFTNPWMWAAIHATGVAAAGVAGIVAWRLNEDVRKRMQAAQDELAIVAETDALTGLGNRRKLLADLEHAMTRPETSLTLFDLDGFKAYNDAFGHHAGDVLLERLGGRLAAAVGDEGTAYRLGGDEFCLLLTGGRRSALLSAGVAALRERGEAFSVESSYGTVELGSECDSAEEALQLADGRMYEQKNGGRVSAGKQSKDVLLRALAERYPDLEAHLDGVSETAGAVAVSLGLSDDEVENICQAAELHDIGKVAIPEAILHKPGPLDEGEWQFMRSHTIIGERIVAAAPALAGAAGLIRSSHERFDGGGYPDGLAGEAIPLGARIIAVCDSFDAMVTDRPYSAARNFDDAIAELERCAGTQFDPTVVGAFVAELRKPKLASVEASAA
jgi:diguanylate cyclase (GGDEF)-like protein